MRKDFWVNLAAKEKGVGSGEWVVTAKRCVIRDTHTHSHTQCAHSRPSSVAQGQKSAKWKPRGRDNSHSWLCTHLRTHESQQPQPGNAYAKALLLLLIRLQLQLRLQLHRAVPDALTAAGDTFLCGCQKYHFIATKMTTLSRLPLSPFPILPCDSVIQIFRLIRRQFAQSKSVIWALPRPAIMKCLTAKPLWNREREGGGRGGVNPPGVATLPLQRIHLQQQQRICTRSHSRWRWTLPVNLTESLHLPAALDPATIWQYATDNRPAGSPYIPSPTPSLPSHLRPAHVKGLPSRSLVRGELTTKIEIIF